MKILFVGNSHTYFNDMPKTFTDLCEKYTNEHTDAFMLAYSGRDLKWHNEEYCSVRFNLLYGNYDYCLIQQLGHPFPGEEVTERDIKPIIELCRKVGCKPIIYESWAEKYRPEYQDIINMGYRNIARKYNEKLLPIGELFQSIIKYHPEIELFHTDGEHASVIGDYMIALALLYLIYPDIKIDNINKTHDFLSDNGEWKYSDTVEVPANIHRIIYETVKSNIK